MTAGEETAKAPTTSGAAPTPEDLFTPEAMVRLLVKGALRRFKTPAEQIESLNKSLDVFDRQLAQTPAHLRNQDPGAKFVEQVIGLLQAEIEAREPQREMVLNQDAQRADAPRES